MNSSSQSYVRLILLAQALLDCCLHSDDDYPFARCYYRNDGVLHSMAGIPAILHRMHASCALDVWFRAPYEHFLFICILSISRNSRDLLRLLLDLFLQRIFA